MYRGRRAIRRRCRSEKRKNIRMAGLLLVAALSGAFCSGEFALSEKTAGFAEEKEEEKSKSAADRLSECESVERETREGQALARTASDSRRMETAIIERDQEKKDKTGDYGAKEERSEPLIVIDAGHGGMDEGCSRGELREKDINLNISILTADILTGMGYQVKLIREKDIYVDKEQRVEEANRMEADAYVSIHQNYCDSPKTAGMETWYDGSNPEKDSRRLACLVQQETARATGAVQREVKSDPELCVTAKTAMSACLVETGFLSNREEGEKLGQKEYQSLIAQGIASGIDLYFHPKTMYLTFDDGPSAEATDQVLDVLKEKNVKATFFVIGEYVRKYPETAKRIAAEGHTIGIHCDVHDYHTLYKSADSFLEDFEKAYETVEEITGVQARLFRFPGGSVNAYNKEVCQEIVKEMTDRGFVYFDWNASLEDAAGEKEPEQLIESACQTTLGRKKVVMLAHDRVEATAQCLRDLIDAFPEYEIKPLDPLVEPVQFILPSSE